MRERGVEKEGEREGRGEERDRDREKESKESKREGQWLCIDVAVISDSICTEGRSCSCWVLFSGAVTLDIN